MKNTQAYIAAIPVALFIAIESVTILLFGPSTTFWIESAFSLVMLPWWFQPCYLDPKRILRYLVSQRYLLLAYRLQSNCC